MSKKLKYTEVKYSNVAGLKAEILLVTAVRPERNAVFERMKPLEGYNRILRVENRGLKSYLGQFANKRAVLIMADTTGTLATNSVSGFTTIAIQQWNPLATIMPGIAFGRPGETRRIGTVLVAKTSVPYEAVSQVNGNTVLRNVPPSSAGEILCRLFEQAPPFTKKNPEGEQCSVEFGDLLSGNTLVNDANLRDYWFQQHPTVIGGEMEGIGLAIAATSAGVEWILAKAICDWGAEKANDHQEFAAATSVEYIHHVLNQEDALSGLTRKIFFSCQESSPKIFEKKYRPHIKQISKVINVKWIDAMGLFFSGIPRVPFPYIQELHSLLNYVSEWTKPSYDSEFESAIHNLMRVLSDFLNHLANVCDGKNNWLIIPGSLQAGHEGNKKHRERTDMVLNLGLEVACAANWVRQHYIRLSSKTPNWLPECKAVMDIEVASGPANVTVTPVYPLTISIVEPYPGLEKFASLASERPYWFKYDHDV